MKTNNALYSKVKNTGVESGEPPMLTSQLQPLVPCLCNTPRTQNTVESHLKLCVCLCVCVCVNMFVQIYVMCVCFCECVCVNVFDQMCTRCLVYESFSVNNCEQNRLYHYEQCVQHYSTCCHCGSHVPYIMCSNLF